VSLLYVAPTQINFLLPAEIQAGIATVEVKLGGIIVGRGNTTVSRVAPALFTITADGKGIPTGYSTFDGKALSPLFNSNGTARPLDPGTAQRPNHLVLFGTGFRNRSNLNNVQVRIGGILCQITYAGSQPEYFGLDQLNVEIPTTTRGSGEVDLLLTVDGRPANTVRVNIGN
jgi:uncharacterized protein (TIGR03437 family)